MTNGKIGLVTQYFKTRVVDQNSNVDCGFFGDRGDGKSYGCLDMGCITSYFFRNRFTIEENCHFYADQFIEQLHKVVKRKDYGQVRRGYCLILDEAGRGMDAQRWWDKHIKIVADEMETYRTYNLVVLLSTPYSKNVTKRARGLFNCYFKPLVPPVVERQDLIRPTSNIHRSIEQSWWKFHLMWRDPVPMDGTDKMFHYRMSDGDGYLTKVRIGLPPKSIVSAYLKKKHEYLDSSREMYLDDTKLEKDEEQKKKLKIDDYIPVILAEKDKYGVRAKSTKRYKFGWEIIAQALGVSTKEAKYLKRQAEFEANKPKPKEVKKSEDNGVGDGVD